MKFQLSNDERCTQSWLDRSDLGTGSSIILCVLGVQWRNLLSTLIVIGKKLHTEQEPDNAVDKFAMKVVKKQRNSWPFTSRVLTNFLVLDRTRRKDMRGSDWPQTLLQRTVQRNGYFLYVGV